MYKDYSKQEFDTFLNDTSEAGFVEYSNHPLVYLSGLPTVRPKEVVLFETGEIGEVLSLLPNQVVVLVFTKNQLNIGTRVVKTGKSLEIPVGEALLGNLIDPLGSAVYKEKPFKRPAVYRAIDIPPLDISSRSKITEPFETGVALVDLMIPLGKGQRELIIGDRKTGKTEFLQQTILTQVKKGAICIYAGIGKLKIDIKKIEDFVSSNNIASSTIIVTSFNADSLGMIYITPYTAMTIAEYFRDLGKDVVVIFDDLTTHAKFYREISLLAKRFPGRNSYPGDIFFTHSRLLERGGNYKTEAGVKSITCLPVAETVEGDLSGYIQTNLMSITDGHIFFDKELFAEGRRPSVNYSLSVTRVGRQTQSTLRWGVNRELNNFLSLLEKTQSFIHFGAEINAGIRATLSMGEKIIAFFDQPLGRVLSIDLQTVLFSMIWVGAIKTESEEKTRFLVGKAMDKYEGDAKFRQLCSELVKSSADFNILLGKVSAKKDELTSYIS